MFESLTNNLKISKLIVIASIIIFSNIIINSSLTIFKSNQLQTHLEDTKDNILAHTFSFMELKLNVVQIQQWLTDVSATRAAEGYDDGFDEAEEYYKKANIIINHLIEAHIGYDEPEMVQELRTFKSNLDDFYKEAKKMADVYIKYGHTAGNVFMSKVDPFAEKLTTQLDAWVKEHREENDSSFDELIVQGNELKMETIIAGLVLLLGVFITFRIMTNILKKIIVVNDHMKQLSKLDFSKSFHVDGKNEIAQIAQSLEILTDSVKDVLLDIGQSSQENMTISNQLSSTTDAVSDNIDEAAIIVNKSSADLNDMSTSLTQFVIDAEESKEDIKKSSEMLNVAVEQIELLSSKIDISVTNEIEVAQRLDELTETASEVKNVLDVISDIADQTNLLALNAAIEAARAGEHGRGFAVVADEVRKLAERTQKSLSEIQGTISVIVQSISDASSMMESNTDDIKILANTSEDSRSKMNDVIEKMKVSLELTDKTVDDFIDTDKKVKEMGTTIQGITNLALETNTSVKEISGASTHLHKVTEELNSKISKFKV